MGKAIPKARRGQLTGWSASAAGLVTVGLGLGILFTDTQLHGGAFYGFLLATAGALWVVAAIIYSLIREFPGETEGGGNALAEAWQRLDILRSDAPFRRFVLTRSLLLSSALVAPYYVALAQQQRGSPVHLLGLFVLAAGLASLLSAPIWGRFADRSSRKVMIAGAVISAVMGIAVFLVVRYLPGLAQSLWFVPVSYFILSIAHDGIRVGRKTYVIDMAQGNRRTDYVAVSNSVIGVVLLAAGLLGTLAAVISLSGVILLFAAVGLVGARLASSLPEVE